MTLGWYSKRALVGLLILGTGIMLLLDTSDALGEDTSTFGTYWPVLLIALPGCGRRGLRQSWCVVGRLLGEVRVGRRPVEW